MKRQNPIVPAMPYVAGYVALSGEHRDTARFARLGDAVNFIEYVGRRYCGETAGCPWYVWDRVKRTIAIWFHPEISAEGGAA